MTVRIEIDFESTPEYEAALENAALVYPLDRIVTKAIESHLHWWGFVNERRKANE